MPQEQLPHDVLGKGEVHAMAGGDENRPATARRRPQCRPDQLVLVDHRPRLARRHLLDIDPAAEQLLDDADGRPTCGDSQVRGDSGVAGMEDAGAIDQQHGGELSGRAGLRPAGP